MPSPGPTALLVTNGMEPAPAILQQSWALARLSACDMYDFPQEDFARYRALWFTVNTDQRLLLKLSDRLHAYLTGGGTMVFCGPVAFPFLPDITPFVPLRRTGVDDLRVHPVTPHPVWKGIDPDNLTFRRGIAGFYGRGANPPPPGAVVINAIGGGTAAVDWVLETPGGGRLLMHSGNDLWMDLDEHNSADRLAPALLDWSLA